MTNNTNFMSLNELKDVLVSPLEKKKLSIQKDSLTDGEIEYKFIQKSPYLIVSDMLKYVENGKISIPLKNFDVALEQYFFMNMIKMYHGNHNSDTNTELYARYLKIMQNLLKDIEGNVLDIGCDNPLNSIKMFPENVKYVGVDPLTECSEFRIIAMAEFLPIADESFDNVCFASSLDHVFDYYKALSEAKRVLKKGGKLIISSLIWKEKSELYHDHVHFHHFKEYEILGALSMLGFIVERLDRFEDIKYSHREGLNIIAVK